MKFSSRFLAGLMTGLLWVPSARSQMLSDPGLDSLLPGLPKTARYKVLYTRIDRGRNGMPGFTTFSIQSANSDTFSSSMVHLPLAAWVLEKVAAEREAGYDLNSTMITEASFGDQMPAYNDPRWPDGRPTIRRYLTNMLLLRDAAAFNRLYEFAGQAWLLSTAATRGLAIRYVHRLGEADEENARHTNPVDFYDSRAKRIYSRTGQYNGDDYPKFESESKAAFSNILRPESLHAFMISLFFPEAARAEERRLNPQDRLFLLRYSSQWPEETSFPLYGRDECSNAFFESFCPEDSLARIFATGGESGSQVVESAFVIDTTAKVEFFLTVAADAGNMGSIEDAYEMLEYCGHRLLDAERKRPRAVLPDLSRFILSYDK